MKSKPKQKMGLLELMEMIQNGEIVPDKKQVPFYDENGRPLHFVKPKQDRKLDK